MKLWTLLRGRGTLIAIGFVRHSPCSEGSEAHKVLLRTRYFNRSPLAPGSILASTYNERVSPGLFCQKLSGPFLLEDDFLRESPGRCLGLAIRVIY